MDIKKLLFVTHLDELRFDALQSVLSLKKANLNHVVLLNVIKRERVAMRRGTGYQKKTEIKLKEKANIRFIDWAENLFEEGMEVGVHIVVGDYISKIVETSITEKVDLIVVGPESNKHSKKLYSRLNFEKIINRSKKPILIYKSILQKISKTENIFKRPLIAINWSTENIEILGYIKNLKNIVEKVDLVHVIGEDELKGSSMSVQKIRKNSRKKLENVSSKIEKFGFIVKSHIYVGDVVSEIDKAAKECNSSIIFSGYSKKSIWDRYKTTSIGKKLIQKSDFSVILIPFMGN